jgi:hypothetical protein
VLEGIGFTRRSFILKQVCWKWIYKDYWGRQAHDNLLPKLQPMINAPLEDQTNQSARGVVQCIWCKNKHRTRAVEHIIPEALGCPEGLIFENGEVCEQCNNHLAYIDRSIIDEYDIMCFHAGIPRKHGAPRVDSRGNAVAHYGPEGPAFYLNMESYPKKTKDGIRMAAFRGRPRNVRGLGVNVEGETTTISYTVSFATSPLFGRAVHKIAFESFTYFCGTETALHQRFDPVREYVMSGTGRRDIILLATESDRFQHEVRTPYRTSDGNYAMAIKLGSIEYFIDLSPKQTKLPSVVSKLKETRGEHGWTLIPGD